MSNSTFRNSCVSLATRHCIVLMIFYGNIANAVQYTTGFPPLACIYMDLRNLSCLISTSGHHWKRDGSRQKPKSLDD